MFSFLPHKFSKYFITFYHRKPRNMLLLPGKKKKKNQHRNRNENKITESLDLRNVSSQ